MEGANIYFARRTACMCVFFTAYLGWAWIPWSIWGTKWDLKSRADIENNCFTFDCTFSISLLARAVITKCHRLDGLNNINLFSHGSGLYTNVQDQGIGKFDFFPSPLSLACLCPSFYCAFTSYSLCVDLCHNLLSYKNINRTECRPMHMTSVCLNCLFKDPISTQLSLSFLGLGLKYINFEETWFNSWHFLIYNEYSSDRL